MRVQAGRPCRTRSRPWGRFLRSLPREASTSPLLEQRPVKQGQPGPGC